jgi:hypothetical protein
MRSCIRPIQTDGSTPNARFCNAPRHILGHHRPVGRQGHSQTSIRSVPCQPKNIIPEQRLAATQHQNRVRKRRNLVDDLKPSLSRQVAGSAQLRRRRPAVNAAEIASLRDFPKN